VVVIRGIRSKSRVSGPTHRDSSVLDLVAACDAVPVSVVCVDRSDHSLLHWPVTSDRPTIPSVLSAPVRGWTWTCFVRDLPRQIFVCRHLGRPTSMRPRHSLYNDVITGILPARVVVQRSRPSDPWFDADCRAAKRLTRRLERASRRAADVVGGPATTSASAATKRARVRWFAQRRAYRQLRHQKSVLFWSNKLTTATGPRDMWSTVDRLLGRGGRACDYISADELLIFFANKVKQIQSTISGAPLPTLRPIY